MDELNTYIDDHILQSKVWDNADVKTRTKVKNNAERVIKMLLPTQYAAAEIPIDQLAEQCIWMLKIDDVMQRSELGVEYVQMDGVSMKVSNIDRSIAPYIMKALNLPNGYFNRRRVASYSSNISDSFRGGCKC